MSDSPTPLSAIAYGLATLAADGGILDTWYPRPSLADNSPPPAPAT